MSPDVTTERKLFNPFPGLRPFETDEAYLYFGRDGQSEEIIRRLARTRFVGVVGTSGSGKSSLVRAGLIPALHGGFMISAGSSWRIALFRPGNNPIRNLAASLSHQDLFGNNEQDNDIATAVLEATLRRSALGLIEATRLAGMEPDETLLVVVDQFEELFRFKEAKKDSPNQDEAAAFAKLLLEAAHQTDMPIYVVLTMRSDYLGDCSQFRDLPEALNDGQYLVPRMTRAQRREAIEGPVAVGGGEIAPRLVQRLLNDVGDDPDQLPVLQHALMRTWDHWQKNRQGMTAIDLVDYEAIGGLAQALDQHADEAYNGLDKRGKKLAEKLFKCLTEKDADNRKIRRATTLEQIRGVGEAEQQEVVHVIDRFRKDGHWFLTPPVGEELTGGTLIDISHESLIRKWKRLDRWVEEECASRDQYLRIVEDALDYQKQQDQGGLWRDPKLKQALDWLESTSPNQAWATSYSPNFDQAVRFLEKSKSRQVAEGAHERKQLAREQERLARDRVRRLLTYGLTVGMMLTVSLAIFATFQWQQATKQRQHAESQRQATLIAISDSYTNKQLDLALLLAVEVNRMSDTGSARSQLLSALQQSPSLIALLHGHTNTVFSVAFSPDDAILASASADGSIRLWDVITRQPLGLPLAGHTDTVFSVAFSPDGTILASASKDQTIRLWDIKTRQPLGVPLAGHTDTVFSVAFSPDGTILVSASKDQMIRLWDVKTRQPLGPALIGHTSEVFSAVFSPEGATLASASRDRTIRLWNVKTHRPIGSPLSGHGDSVMWVTFSPDGTTLTSASGDNTIRLWDVKTQQPVATLAGHTAPVFRIAFSPGGAMLASASGDKTIRLWDIHHRQFFENLSGHSGRVCSIAFSSDGAILASASRDEDIRLWDMKSRKPIRTFSTHDHSENSVAFSPRGVILASTGFDKSIRLWDVKTEQLVGQPLTGHSDWVSSIAFSPDGTLLASASLDKTVRVWDIKAWQLIGTLSGHSAPVNSVVFSPDGSTLASASWDHTIRLWDVKTRQLLDTLSGHSDGVFSVAFSPDGRTIASASGDKTIRLWEVKTRQPIGTLSGHADAVFSVAFNPDGAILASGSADHSVRLWDAKTWLPIGILAGHNGLVLSVAFSPDGRTLASSSHNWAILLWDVDVGSWETRACGIANRNFSAEEWKKFFGDQPYRRTCPDLPISAEAQQADKVSS
jgi:WD40 repeat protein